MPAARLRVEVRGRVQAVGFRAYVEREAWQLGIRGWVRNVGDECVEVLAEGDRTILERFIDVVRTGPRGSRVDDLQAEWGDATGEFGGFTVRRSI